MASRTLSTKCLRLSAAGSPSHTFLNLAPTRSISTKPAFQAPLDFLLPIAAQRKLYYGCTSFITSPKNTNTPRTFYSAPSRRATVAIVNPKKDDDGNDMTIDITPRASTVSLPFLSSRTIVDLKLP